MIKLRAHHLICIWFITNGYNQQFKNNLQRVLKKSRLIKIIEGPDEICKHCPHLFNTQCSLYGEQEIVEGDREAKELLEINVGEKVSKELIQKKLPKIIEVWRKEHCEQGCLLWKECKAKQKEFLKKFKSSKL